MKSITVVVLLVIYATLLLWIAATEDIVRSHFLLPPIVKHSEGRSGFGSSWRKTLMYPSHGRVRRNPYSSCVYPTDLSDSALDCVTYPSKVVCIHTCVFGHTLSGGISQKMSCDLTENKWMTVSPSETCKPFVDCGVTVGPGGKFKCHKNFMNRGPYCEISCSHYEDKDPVPKAVYQCDINGKWTPELPFCVKAGSGVMLVPEPRGPKLVKDL